MSATNPEFRALIADPSTHMAGLVTLMLHTLKIRGVDEAGDTLHATEFLARRPYNLVLIDDALGSQEDFALIRMLRSSADHPNRTVPIIMMAAAPEARLIARARDAGVTEFLRKPFSAQHIQLRLDAIRNAPRPFIEAQRYVGPDRRRHEVAGTPQRRASDRGNRSA
ncbi:MAG TPA: response regulator [Devosia sp.]|jgi:DNA-binding response OmpR family regulator|nr:response regulator [Devosia sp.]